MIFIVLSAFTNVTHSSLSLPRRSLVPCQPSVEGSPSWPTHLPLCRRPVHPGSCVGGKPSVTAAELSNRRQEVSYAWGLSSGETDTSARPSQAGNKQCGFQHFLALMRRTYMARAPTCLGGSEPPFPQLLLCLHGGVLTQLQHCPAIDVSHPAMVGSVTLSSCTTACTSPCRLTSLTACLRFPQRGSSSFQEHALTLPS